MGHYMLGIDIGTTSTKAVLFSEQGAIVQQEHVEYPLHTPDIATAEQDPEEIFQAVIQVMTSILKKHSQKRLLFVSFSSAMHSVMALDKHDKPLTSLITWADNRSAEWAENIKKEQEIYKKTGTPIHPMSPLCKITWLVHEQRDIAKKAKKYIGIKEYIFKKLFNQYVIDQSIASCTGMMNFHTLDWDEQALSIAGITREQLSKIVPTTTVFTNCHSELAKQIGLDRQTPFIIGASDGVLSNLGVNAFRKGEIAVTIGTSGAIRTVIDEPKVDLQGRTFCYALTEKHWVIGGPVNNGGVILRWIRDQWTSSETEAAKGAGLDPYEHLTKMAAQVRPGADGLIFHPYLAGERAPLWNPDVRGSFFGLTLSHKKEHMIRAALEGVLYNLYTVFQALTTCMDGPVTKIYATGGFARSAVWRQMLADIFEAEVVVPESFESSCLGACILGLYGIGRIDSFEVAAKMVGNTFTHVPNEAASQQYRQLLPIFTSLVNNLKDEYIAIANYQRTIQQGNRTT